MGIEFQEEKFDDVKSELEPIFKKHWEELANNKDTRPLDVDYTMYSVMSDLQILKVFTVRVDGKLIGYSFWIVAKHLHYKTWLYAVSDVYWLDPEHRKTGIALDFFFKIEDWLKGLGVKSITVQDKLTHKHNNFFNKLGYKPIEQLYEKII